MAFLSTRFSLVGKILQLYLCCPSVTPSVSVVNSPFSRVQSASNSVTMDAAEALGIVNVFCISELVTWIV